MAGRNERISVGLNAEWVLLCAEPAHAAMVRGQLEASDRRGLTRSPRT
ncbi:hypothetical protein [Streptomyces sp. AK02-04a]|nr:hypothetical protein [Streptomyces sp. AK02-04a]MDX3763575.1 hypothetical protein [Streptomyces sp. AK02-04a]